MAQNTYLRFELGSLSAEQVGQLQDDIRAALGDTGAFTMKTLIGGGNAHLDGVATGFRIEDTDRDGKPEALLLKVQPGGGNNAATEIGRHLLGAAPSVIKCGAGAALSCAGVVLDASSIPGDVRQFKTHSAQAEHWKSNYNVGEAIGEKLYSLLMQPPATPSTDTSADLSSEDLSPEAIANAMIVTHRDDQGRATMIAAPTGATLGIRWNDNNSVTLYNPQTQFSFTEVTKDDFEKGQKLPHAAKTPPASQGL